MAHRQDEILIQAVTDVLRELESIKLEATQFNASGATFGDILVADANLVFQPQKYVPLTFGVGGNLTVTGTATVTGTTSLKGALNVTGNAVFVANHSVGGNLAVTGTATVTGNTTLYSRLIVSGDPAASTTLPKVQVGDPVVGGSSDGAVYGANVSSSSDLIYLQKVGVTKFLVNSLGNVLIAGGEATPKLNFGATTNSYPALAAVGNTLQCYKGDFSTLAEFYAASIGAQGSMFAFGVNSQIGVSRRDSNNNAWSFYSAAGELNIYDVVNSQEPFVMVPGGATAFILRDATSNTNSVGWTFRHNTSNTPAAGFGSKLAFQLKSSTTNDRDAGGLSYEWEVATEGSQISLGRLSAYYITTEREVMQWGATSSKPTIGFLGATRAIQQTGGAATAGVVYTATEQGMLQAAYDALRTFGFLS